MLVRIGFRIRVSNMFYDVFGILNNVCFLK